MSTEKKAIHGPGPAVNGAHRYLDAVHCPACGYHHGDEWEWCTSEIRGHEVDCDNCGATFRAFPHFSVSYSTELVPKKGTS